MFLAATVTFLLFLEHTVIICHRAFALAVPSARNSLSRL